MDHIGDFSQVFIALLALFFSIIGHRQNLQLEQKNTLLTIHQKLLDYVLHRVEICNSSFSKEVKTKNGILENTNTVNSLVMSIEGLEKSIQLFGRKNKLTSSVDLNSLYYVFWKQLSPELREFVMSAKSVSKYSTCNTYKSQIDGLHLKFKPYFEKVV